MLKLEQAGERLHSQLNVIERRLHNVKDKALKYWYLLLEYENSLNCNMDYLFQSKQKEGDINKTSFDAIGNIH